VGLWRPQAQVAHCALPLSGNSRKPGLGGAVSFPLSVDLTRTVGDGSCSRWPHGVHKGTAPAVLNVGSQECVTDLLCGRCLSRLCRSWWAPHLLQAPTAALWYLWPRPVGIAGVAPWHRLTQGQVPAQGLQVVLYFLKTFAF